MMTDVITLPTQLVIEDIGAPLCSDFDGCCFEVPDKQECHKGGDVWIMGEMYEVSPADGICPFLPQEKDSGAGFGC